MVDCHNPHRARILARTAEQQVWIYVDIRVDDSYTPHKISIRAGTFHGDLHEVKWVELQQAKGWQVMSLTGTPGSPDEG